MKTLTHLAFALLASAASYGQQTLQVGFKNIEETNTGVAFNLDLRGQAVRADLSSNIEVVLTQNEDRRTVYYKAYRSLKYPDVLFFDEFDAGKKTNDQAIDELDRKIMVEPAEQGIRALWVRIPADSTNAAFMLGQDNMAPFRAGEARRVKVSYPVNH